MPRTKVVIRYSLNLARYTSVTVPVLAAYDHVESDGKVTHYEPDPDTWDDVEVHKHAAILPEGHESLIVDLDTYRQLGPHAIVERHLGKPPLDDRCAVLDDNGIVIDFIHADRAIHQHAGGKLHHDKLSIGDRVASS